MLEQGMEVCNPNLVRWGWGAHALRVPSPPLVVSKPTCRTYRDMHAQVLVTAKHRQTYARFIQGGPTDICTHMLLTRVGLQPHARFNQERLHTLMHTCFHTERS